MKKPNKLINYIKNNNYLFVIRILLFTLSIYYIGLTVVNNLNHFKSFSIPINSFFLSYSFLIFLVYFAISLFLAFAWLALNQFQNSKDLFQIYLKSIALKYLPGNVLHYFYRHNESRRIGQSHKQLIEATLLETIGQVLIASIVASLLLFWPDSINKVTDIISDQILIVSALILIVLLFMIITIRMDLTQFIVILTLYSLYYLGLGLICILSLKALGFETLPYWQISAIFAIAWLAGYITPGAPGGIGVREAVFILLGTPALAEFQAIILIAYIRIISIITESIIYSIAPKITRLFHPLLYLIDKKAP